MAASVAAHLAALALLLTHHWDFDVPSEQPDSPWEHVVTVSLAPRPHAAGGAARPMAVLGRTPRPGEPSPPPPPRETLPPSTSLEAAPTSPAPPEAAGAAP
ncbi:MAG: hypothetical protein JSS35_02560, partial [Proteobacteria bacterium]|nr:hypothetical protein [Pseudomonadota bacterium]